MFKGNLLIERCLFRVPRLQLGRNHENLKQVFIDVSVGEEFQPSENGLSEKKKKKKKKRFVFFPFSHRRLTSETLRPSSSSASSAGNAAPFKDIRI